MNVEQIKPQKTNLPRQELFSTPHQKAQVEQMLERLKNLSAEWEKFLVLFKSSIDLPQKKLLIETIEQFTLYVRNSFVSLTLQDSTKPAWDNLLSRLDSLIKDQKPKLKT